MDKDELDAIPHVLDAAEKAAAKTSKYPVGCGMTAIFVLMLFLAAGLVATTSEVPISSVIQTSSQANAGDSALPIFQPSSAGASTPAGSGGSAAPAQTTTTAPGPTTTQSSSENQTPSDQNQNPSQQASPPATPAPTQAPACDWVYPSEIDISGGSPSVIGGSGGSFTVDGSPVVISASMTPCGGHHYELEWSSNGPRGGNGSDCEMAQFNDDITSYVDQGDTISVQIILPINSCG